MSWLKQLFTRHRRYDDLSVSIQEHLDERIDELVEEGMPRQQAEQTARRQFGNVTLLQQRSREAWQWPRLESFLADLKFTARRLRKSPGFAITVILTLALGIGANTAVFSVLNRVLIQPLPYPHPEELVDLRLQAPGAGGLANFTDGLRLSTSMYLTFADHNRSFQSLGIFTDGAANVTGIAQPEQVHTAYISEGILETLAVPPVAGRWLSHDDQQPHGARTVMINYSYWQRRFGGDHSAIGRTIQVDAQPYQIVGVMPRNFRIVNQDFDILIPLALDRTRQILAGFGYQGVARLRPGIAIPQANADLTRLIGVWMDTWTNGPGTNPHFYENWKITPDLRPLKDAVIGSIGGILWVVMATIGLVMLIACTNVANLLLVRADARQQELAIRAALGAGRARLARELIVESLALALIGGVFGIAVADGGLRLLLSLGPANLPRLNEIALDPLSLLFTLLLAVFSGLLFGAIPAVKYSTARASLSASVRTASTSRERQRSRNLLVVAQVAMALILLISALLMIRTFAALRSVQPGFSDPARVQTMRISIPDQLISDPVMVAHIQNEILDKLAAIPGITSASFASAIPMDGIEPNWDQIRIEGTVYQHDDPPLRFFNFIAPGYFSTVGTRFLAGRDLNWAEIYALHPSVIVSESFARESWGSAQAAVGKRLQQFDHGLWYNVVGVVEDVRQRGVDAPPPAIVYWPVMINDPYSRKPILSTQRGVTFVLHTDRAGTQGLLAQMQQAVWSINSDLPLAAIGTLQDQYSQSLARISFTLAMLAIAGSMALALGVIGIYGVIAYAVAQRTREIGIRLALGAQKSSLRWIFVRSALLLTGAGIAIGILAAAGLMQFMKSLLFGISPIDPLTYIVIPIVLISAAALASYLPARRAAAVDPIEALRQE